MGMLTTTCRRLHEGDIIWPQIESQYTWTLRGELSKSGKGKKACTALLYLENKQMLFSIWSDLFYVLWQTQHRPIQLDLHSPTPLLSPSLLSCVQEGGGGFLTVHLGSLMQCNQGACELYTDSSHSVWDIWPGRDLWPFSILKTAAFYLLIRGR